MAVQKTISKKKKIFFKKKLKRILIILKNYRKLLNSLGMKSGKLNQSKIAF